MAKIKQGSGGPVQFRHRMEGLTSLVLSHRHSFGNLSDIVIFRGWKTPPYVPRHYDYSRWTSSFLSGQTGLNIGVGPNHFHRFQIFTNITNGHRHVISGRTTGDIRTWRHAWSQIDY